MIDKTKLGIFIGFILILSLLSFLKILSDNIIISLLFIGFGLFVIYLNWPKKEDEKR